MAAAKHFRSAFRGFNREDVVNYIEYLNNQHNAQVEQLNNQLQVALARSSAADNGDLQAQLDAALEKIAQLEQQLARQDAPQSASCTEAELEAYRRAERAERVANERAQQIYTQANAALADATAKAEAASDRVGAITDQIAAQLKEYQSSVLATKDTFQEAVASLGAIRPEE